MSTTQPGDIYRAVDKDNEFKWYQGELLSTEPEAFGANGIIFIIKVELDDEGLMPPHIRRFSNRHYNLSYRYCNRPLVSTSQSESPDHVHEEAFWPMDMTKKYCKSCGIDL